MHRLIELSLHNRLLMAFLLLGVMAGGYRSYRNLPVDAFPDVSPNLVQVFTVTAGLAPEEVEKFVTYPVESAMTGLPGVREVRSISNFGLSVVSIYFEEGMDIYFCRQLVGERLTEAREQVPEGFGEPEMGPISTGMGLILYYYLEDTTGSYSLTELRTMQDWIIKFNLQTVPGVTEVLGIGGFEKQYQVNVHPDDLIRYGLTIGEIIERVRANNLNVGAQYIERAGEQFVVRSVGLAREVSDLQSIVVKTEDGTPVYLRDVADVKIGGAIRRGLQTRNGEEEVVSGMVIQLYGSNASTVIDRVEAKLAEVQRALPEGVKIVPYYEQKELVAQSVSTVTHALVQGILLVILVLLVFMEGFRPSIVVAASIPFSVLFATLAMSWFEISANLMSFGGLAIAIGIMVDGTIVMVENVDRMLHEADPSEPRLHVVRRGCQEVLRPIVFAVTIIIVVFLPLFTLQGVEGKTFRPLAYTVALAMLGSLCYALLLAPMLSQVLMRQPRVSRGHPAGRWSRWIVRSHKEPSSPAPKVPAPARQTAAGQNLIVRTLLALYRPMVRLFVRQRWAAVALAAVLLACGAVVFPRLGMEFTPRLNEGDIMINGTLAPSISITESRRMTLLMEKRVLRLPEVAQVVTRIGRGEVGAHSEPVNVVHSNVILKPREEWPDPTRTQPEIETDIRAQLKDFPGMATNITQPIQLTVDELIGGVKAELAIKLFGTDLELLKSKADEIAAEVQQVNGAADVQAAQVVGAPQLVIRPNREKIARYGINIERVQETIRAAVGGVSAGLIFEGIRRFDIYVRFVKEARWTPEAIGHILIDAPGGAAVPLDQLATIRQIVGPRQITRENTHRFITVQCNVVGRDIGTFVEEAQKRVAEFVELPAGYFITWGGQFELAQQANRRLAVVVPVTLGLISLLLYMSFGSIKNTVLILLNIPLALVGGVVALWVSGLSLSVPASVGLIALFGIALENSMVLVTYLNQLLRDGVAIDEASVRGGCLRLRPVLMTALTTALGLIPLLLATGTGSEVQRPLATVVIGGLVTSTILTLLIIPALYKWFAVRPSEA